MAPRELLVEFYAGFNAYVTGGDPDAVRSLLADEVGLTATGSDPDQPERTATGVDAVLDGIGGSIRDETDHLQAVPDEFTAIDETVAVSGAYVGTVGDEHVDIPFVHVYELEGETIQHCWAYIDTTLDGVRERITP
ncbi:nuclear transport factor 2 family protein [Natronolimnohabitans innermongolicus]|uniref:SnoaL-like domain-containing protein n=1 Tax=Natronolimnohabitans innermongolicus JCM 12255 TaxID=1227499 RepID=L9XHT7_9EURY|nr:nuclear transport factor 2 family protein [Natronolimnohabitans innermongolicus]ELY61167.1 hypothetical protein C493_02598 [Natronolimnohabitans innermongolicus JCM 12255]